MGVATLLDHARDEIALTAGELTKLAVVFGLLQPLQHDLLGRGGGDAPEVVGSVVVLPHRLALFVELLDQHRDVAGLAVEIDSRVLVGAGLLVIGGQQGLLDRLDHRVERHLTLLHQCTQDAHVDIHQASSP